MKKRLDILVYEKGFTDSREKAKAIIMSGQVYVDNQKADKCGTSYDENVKIEVRGNTQKYVSRGGLKLEKAIDNFDFDLKDKITMDIGASTGGFTDCMLQNGAKKVDRDSGIHNNLYRRIFWENLYVQAGLYRVVRFGGKDNEYFPAVGYVLTQGDARYGTRNQV